MTRTRPLLLAVIAALVSAPLFVACPTGTATEGEGEGEATEGEGENNDELPSGGPVDVGNAPFGYDEQPPGGVDPNATCSTSQWWQFGDAESQNMHPGGDCIQCHTDRGEFGLIFDGAGTVTGGVDDTDDCRGVPGVTVDILDADGNVALSTTTNSAGNFFFEQPLPSPYTARLNYGGFTREMLTPQTDGNCATCHTAEGTGGAPGRIVAP